MIYLIILDITTVLEFYPTHKEYCLLISPLFINYILIYGTKSTSIKSVSSLIMLLILATIIAIVNFIQTTLAQPIMDSNSMSRTNGGAAGMNFNPLSLANNMLNASSIYGSVGISMVNGVKVTSINLLGNNEISVTLRHLALSDNDANASAMSSPPQRVTVTAIRAPMNLKDLMSLASESSKMMAHDTNNTMINPMMMGGPMQGFGVANNGTNNVNPLSLLTALQIGSSTTANADWNLPQTVRMGLTGMLGNTNTNDSTASTADFIIVTVIPYTGKV